ncbi:DUF6732 family protein [Thalassovita taeanensis]|uniref:Uncharacterized protein n=1 Tax=Thalassovita taeanensis TaxID=657014 RepID=A0A1H9B554_9RHOB|nr:DUF6732 family protein [Thalassovita taeanensis]SEP83985.1 hypothetical protein SAMN04488092_102375 [Thalassovita taeanensis]
MRYFHAILAGLLPAVWAGQAAAHPGHLAEVAGHGHWLAGVAIGAAIAIGLWQGLKGKGKDEAASDEAEAPCDEELQDA